MKIKDGFKLREIAGNFIVVAVGSRVKEFNGVINLNEVSAFIWKKLESNTTEEEIVNALIQEYDVDKQTAEKDCKAFIEKLKEAKLLK